MHGKPVGLSKAFGASPAEFPYRSMGVLTPLPRTVAIRRKEPCSCFNAEFCSITSDNSGDSTDLQKNLYLAQLCQSTILFRNTLSNLFVNASCKQIAVCHRSLLSMFWLQIFFLAIDCYYLLYYLFFHEYEVMTCHNFGLS